MLGTQLIKQARAQKRLALDEKAGKAFLSEFHITVPSSTVVKDEKELEAQWSQFSPPVVLKVVSPDILHKSDVGGVKLSLQNLEAVKAAMALMKQQPGIKTAKVEGFLIEEMAPPGQEMVVGGYQDPQFGPMVMVGLGGIFVEILADVSFRICPIDEQDARQMLSELKAVAILKGARGHPPVSMEAIVEVLMNIGGEQGLLMRYQHDIEALDINPLLVSATQAVAVDARIILRAHHE